MRPRLLDRSRGVCLALCRCCFAARRALVARDEYGLWRLTLRFEDAAVEKGFLQKRAGELASHLWGLSILGFASYILGALRLVLAQRQVEEACPAVAQWIITVQLAIAGAMAVVSMLLAGFSQVSWLLLRIGPFGQEIALAWLLVVSLVANTAAQRYYLLQLGGWIPEEVCPSSEDLHSDSYVLMAIIANTSWHLVIPVRCCSLLPLQAVGMLIYSFLAFVVGSPEPANVNLNIFMLALILCLQIAGSRSKEFQERVYFLSVLVEKELRCRSEFQLSQLSSGIPTGSNEEERACSESQAETVGTGKAFELSCPSSLQKRLERIRDIGHRERWLIAEDDLRLLPHRLLGNGTFGSVVAALLHGTSVVAKIPRHAVISGGFQDRHLIQLGNELRVLRHVRHPNIVQFHGACIIFSPNEILLVLELVDGETLDDFLLRRPPEDAKRFKVALDVSCALRYMHTREPKLVHGDLKPSNIAVEAMRAAPRAKLLDFGLSRVLTAGARPLGGTFLWMAPELICNKNEPPETAADVFSFGRVLYFVATGIVPLRGLPRAEIIRLAKANRTPPVVWLSGGAMALAAQPVVDRCVSSVAAARPSLVDVCKELAVWRPQFGLPHEDDCDCESHPFTCLRDEIHAIRERDTRVVGRRTPRAAALKVARGQGDDAPGQWWARRMEEQRARQQRPAESPNASTEASGERSELEETRTPVPSPSNSQSNNDTPDTEHREETHDPGASELRPLVGLGLATAMRAGAEGNDSVPAPRELGCAPLFGADGGTVLAAAYV